MFNAALLPSAASSTGADCAEWAREDFFKKLILRRYGHAIIEHWPNVRDESGQTPLHWAAAYADDPRLIAFFLRWQSAEPDLRRKDGSTAVHVAAEKSSQPSIITTLTLYGADVDMRVDPDEGYFADWGTTALHLAGARGDAPEVVAALLFAGAQTDALDAKGRNPLHHAARTSPYPRTVETLLLADPDEANRHDDDGGWTPLHVAATANPEVWVTTTLLFHGAGANEVNEKGQTPLHMAAAYSKDPAILANLILHTEAPCAKDDEENRALDYAEVNERMKGTKVFWRLHDECYGK